MSLLHIPRLLLPLLTDTPFSNSWYVSTWGFPSAEQLKVTTEPWHTVVLLTVNLKFSGLSARFKSELECYCSLHCKCYLEFPKILGQNVLLYKLQVFITIFSHRKSRNCTWLCKFTMTFKHIWYCQSTADMSLAFHTILWEWWMTNKILTTLNPRFSKLFLDYGCYQNWDIKVRNKIMHGCLQVWISLLMGTSIYQVKHLKRNSTSSIILYQFPMQ